MKGFALVNFDPDLHFCYLDFIFVKPHKNAGGVGGTLQQRVREEALRLVVCAIFMECLPDESRLCRAPDIPKQNRGAPAVL